MLPQPWIIVTYNYIVSPKDGVNREEASTKISSIPHTFSATSQSELNEQVRQFEAQLRLTYTIITKSVQV